jgi:arsenate reductase-like glutaredoxin family protein
MKKIYLLNSCSTCQRILSQIGTVEGLELQNIKEENIDEKMLDWLKDKV